MAKAKGRAKASTSRAASILGGIGKKAASKSTSTTPQIPVSDESTLEAMAAIIDAKNCAKEADSALKIAEGAFRSEATDLLDGRCRADGTLHTSVRLMGTLTPDGEDARPLVLRFERKRCCKKMDEADASDPLHSAFGADFDDLFAPKRTIEIDTSKLTDQQIEALVEAMQEAIGDSFDAAVAVQSLILPKEAFFGRRILDAKIRVKAENAEADGFAVPFMPSFKL